MPDQEIFAIAYARVSTNDQSQNPESQLLRIRQWAKERGITILREYKDEKTGTNDDRDGLDAAIGFASRTPQLSMMIVLDADRLSRNMDDAPAIIKKFNSYGVRITYVADESLDLTTKEGKLINAMKSYGAQSYTDSHRLKIQAGMDRARKEGKHIGRPRVTEEDVNLEILMGLIRNGESLRTCEKVFKISRNTLRKIVYESHYKDEYLEIMKTRPVHGKVPKGTHRA
jgi:DNA invertase Pin-like site-specific DNA recombinase